jgi:hypothetical protein
MNANARKATKFHYCQNHQNLAGRTRREQAEMCCEGGPATGKPCDEDAPCRMWAGTDFFVESVCHGEYQLAWGVNNYQPTFV